MAKRIISIVAVVILAVMYIATFISALLSTPESPNLFIACLVMTILVPIVLWIFLVLYKRAHAQDDEQISLSEMKKYQKRIKKGEDPNKIADEIEEKYNIQEEK